MTDYAFPLLVGEETVAHERQLLRQVQDGEIMTGPEAVRFLVVHCSATRADRDYTPEQLLRDHKARGFRTIGYHAYIRKDGSAVYPRKWLEVGAHARGYNRCSVGICYEGGLDAAGNPADTRTPAQRRALRTLLRELRRMFPAAQVVGHCELPGVRKACPCFLPSREYASL